MPQDVLALLKIHDYFRGVSEEAIQDVLRVGQIRSYESGDLIHSPEDAVTATIFVLRGRVKAVRIDSHGREIPFAVVERGGQMGMLLSVLHEPMPVRVFALEFSTILVVNAEHGVELILKHPDLRALWMQSYAKTMRKMYFGAAPSRGPMVLGLMHESPATRPMAERLITRLCEVGETIGVFSDSEHWR
jgi:NTE family protein